MKLNFDFTILDLDGSPVKDGQGNELNAGKTAASIIMQSVDPSTDIMTKFDWATQLHKTGSVDLDKAGQVQFRRMIESLPNVSLIIRGILIEVIEKRDSELQPEQI